MSEKLIRMSLNVPADVPDKVADLAGSKRKMGGYITDLIRQLYEEKVNPALSVEEVKEVPPSSSDLEVYKAATINLLDRVKALELRVAQLERR